MSDQDKDDQILPVGYKKPPTKTQFKPGQSGNPKGRPPLAKNLSTIVREAINELVVINENGCRRKISKLEVSLKQLVNKAASGDHKSIQQVITLSQMLDGSDQEKKSTEFVLKEPDNIVIKTVLARLRKNIPNRKK
ncbi:MAG: hypothetical protein J0L77_00255 [Alphaproteobacteria bacterium]|nr:hypothetical protein [Alphaproteobacteria bacterium]